MNDLLNVLKIKNIFLKATNRYIQKHLRMYKFICWENVVVQNRLYFCFVMHGLFTIDHHQT